MHNFFAFILRFIIFFPSVFLIIVILIILVIVIYNVFFAKQTMLMSGIHSTATGVIIHHSKLPKN